MVEFGVYVKGILKVKVESRKSQKFCPEEMEGYICHYVRWGRSWWSRFVRANQKFTSDISNERLELTI